ncbi:hypothetical protein GCM10011504_58770 [Siccirubricoccus deserti]|uniref:DUF1326 domain-containing protein n=2 Tax=Siccirubricoccus deserti TaxID=2013562 RepID=A0A9X0R6E6_9PROT|nr:DUF1326 domain-containing protein [Siccirubricoccus deserti]GGC73718.1 hypothetical protein GCM10011504_58770 [Siccirubricoccus deserti]
MTEWEAHGMTFANCNCAYGCPCQFNALPTYGDCRAVVFTRIDRGRFGEVALDGVKGGIIVSWPGPVHMGKGVMQPFVDERANPAQRDALLRILTGQDTEEMATGFWVYAKMCDTIHEPVYTRVEIEIDMEARTAQCRAEGLAETRGEPIRNPVTGAEHRVGILQPNGFEYEVSEIGRGWSEAKGTVPMRLEDSYGSWFELHMTQSGVIRGANRGALAA